MEEDATFGVFCRRWGVPLIDGYAAILVACCTSLRNRANHFAGGACVDSGTVRLPRLIGMSRALDMVSADVSLSLVVDLQPLI